MFALVLFNDGIYFICKSKNVTKHGNEYVAKYRNIKYTCRILAQHSKYILPINTCVHVMYLTSPCIYNYARLMYNSFNIQQRSHILFKKVRNNYVNLLYLLDLNIIF